jgi:hypothetical protein
VQSKIMAIPVGKPGWSGAQTDNMATAVFGAIANLTRGA